MQRGIFALLLVIALGSAAHADIKTLASGKVWSAYSTTEQGKATCYLVGQPVKSLPAGTARGGVNAIVSHRTAEKAWYVVTFNLGYAAKEGGKAELAIDGKKFTLFIEKDAAWAPDAPTDKAISEALAKGKTATLKAASAKGTATTDTYSLEGFGQAFKAINDACKAPR